MTPIALPLLLAALSTGAATATDTVVVGPGSYRSLYAEPRSDGSGRVEVSAFRLDRYPVTNEEFLAFVTGSAQWRKGEAKALFIDERYLRHWQGPLELGPLAPPRAPVVNVSWFAAKAYCAAQGKRLPREHEWELAASAGERSLDGTSEPGFLERILSWYAAPTPKVLPDVGGRAPNAWGTHDLHGLVWEWVLDYAASFAPGDSRRSDDDDARKMCGAGAATAAEKSDYAAFMRSAFRSSLEARYTNPNLGFRCALDLDHDLEEK